jgi:hypothetical protein
MVIALRPSAQLVTDFPYDGVEQGSEIVRPGGLAATMAIAEILAGLGLSVSAPMDVGDDGWELQAQARGLGVWLQISDLGEGLILQTWENTSIWDRIFTPQPISYAAVLVGLNEGLKRHPKFTRATWREDVFDKKGRDTPVDGNT